MMHHVCMTDLHVIDGDRHGDDESLTEVVARRLRGQLAERRIKSKDVAELTRWGKTTVWRKIHGHAPLDTNEMDVLWKLFGISPTTLLTGADDPRPWPGPGGGGPAGVPSTTRTYDLRIITPNKAA
jgi:hypothetical protein